MNSLYVRNPLFISATLHFLSLFVILFLTLHTYEEPKSIQRIEFTVFKTTEIKIKNQPLQLKPLKQPLAKKIEAKPHAVYGLNRQSLTSESNESMVTLKRGNTIAKAMDHETLKPEDEDSLPNPTDEFLVSSMPELISETRIPYPKEAREKNIEGPVVLEILIDDKGQVRNSILISGPGFGLNEAALDAVKGFKFKPAKMENKNVAVKIRYTYRFVLETR